jgi:hypothetical protein
MADIDYTDFIQAYPEAADLLIDLNQRLRRVEALLAQIVTSPIPTLGSVERAAETESDA